MGFSDTTVVSNVLFSHAWLVNFSGPVFGILRNDWHEKERMFEQLGEILDRPKGRPAYHELWNLTKFSDYFEFSDDNPEWLVEDDGIQIVQDWRAQWTILGGNLGTFSLLFWTEWSPDLSGKILFLEEWGGDDLGDIRRRLTHLRQQPTADKIAGLVFGKLNRRCFREYDIDWHQTLLDIFWDLHIPIITWAPFGHIYPFQIFPIGGVCEVDTQERKYTINW